MPLTYDEALAQEVRKDRAAAARRAIETARTCGVHFGGMSPEPFIPRSRAQLETAAVAAVEASAEYAASPKGRFLACIIAAQQIAARDEDEALHAACEMARACASRGLEGELDHAAKLLTEIDLLGGDVRTAWVALRDAGHALPLAAE